MAKGSLFERQICKELSLWWTEGKRDDIFWRTAGSGGRATSRARRRQSTANSHGDICALDPLGKPLLDALVFELKRGYNWVTLHDVVDKAPHHKKQEFEYWVDQAISSMNGAGAASWAIIHKRDQRRAMIYLPFGLVTNLGEEAIISVTLQCLVRRDSGPSEEVAGMPLETFFSACSPRSFPHVSRPGPEDRYPD